jgi:very-short-patch-repair endonuclease
MDILRGDADGGFSSDFYVYRYLASEGFLPGYNFPRLPLTALLPGSRSRRRRTDFLSRQRFLAISEFGPKAVVYHEGSKYTVDRVQIPSSARATNGQLLTSAAKLCAECGHIHPQSDANGGANVCESCGCQLTVNELRQDLLQLNSVKLRRRESISCDEEERMRQGYDIVTGIEARTGCSPDLSAIVKSADGEPLVELTYISACTIWRINQGWRRRQDQNQRGFKIDNLEGRWISDAQATLHNDEDDFVDTSSVQIVVPCVKDRRNALLFKWSATLDPAVHASLMAALKSAIQIEFQLEDQELAAEPLPSSETRNLILFYEAAEGGAGVLRRLIEDPDGLRRTSLRALELCHFDPKTGEDLGRAVKAKEDCSAACYDCLMSYGNQRDHLLLDRHSIKEHLVELSNGLIELTGNAAGPTFEELEARCGSGLEKQWLKFVREQNRRLPTDTQRRIEIGDLNCIPDFEYQLGQRKVVVFVDGPPHDDDEQKRVDARNDRKLMTNGIQSIRFRHKDGYPDPENWLGVLHENRDVFGDGL